MHTKFRSPWGATLAFALLAPATAGAQDVAAPGQSGVSKTATTPAGDVISSHQIDRYEAIRQLQDSLRSDPNNLTDWVILGELAQEVATEIPAEQARAYYRTATEAFENALKIRPDDRALQAAARFARDQETDAPRFDQSRKQATTSYLGARRRELSERGPSPTVRVYTAPSPASNAQASPPATAGPGAPPAQTNYAAAPYGYPQYRPYTNQTGEPYTYDQYSRGYFPPSAQPGAAQPGRANPAAQPPQTLRQYTQQLPNVLMNEAVQRATGAAPAGVQPAPVPVRPR